MTPTTIRQFSDFQYTLKWTKVDGVETLPACQHIGHGARCRLVTDTMPCDGVLYEYYMLSSRAKPQKQLACSAMKYPNSPRI